LHALKRLILIAVVACVALAAACSSKPTPGRFPQKIVVLGFDGMDPHLLKQWMDAGAMPNFSKLAAKGGFWPLGTTVSPESPTSWASFATGVNAGKHNIFDFLVRDTQTYLPDFGLVKRVPPTFLFNYLPVSRPRVLSIRGGTSFWVTAGEAGVPSEVMTVPDTFPPEDVPNGELLSGLPLPDIRGTIGTFYYFGTDLSRYEEGNTEFGGILKRLVMNGDTAQTELVGPPNPIVRQQISAIRAKGAALTDADRSELARLDARADVRVPMTVHWNRAANAATIDIQGHQIHLRTGGWSPWVNLDFRINLLIRLHGMCQFYLIRADQELQLYVSPINFKPDQPPVPISSPDSLSGELASRLGPYRTLGWAEATWGLNEDRIDEQAFMDDLFRAFNDRERVILDRMDHRPWNLFVGVIESTDRVEHMMWRLIDPSSPMYDASLAAKYGDSIERVYRRCDDFVGKVMQRVGPDVPIIIVSDHGFHSFRQSVNLNTWLVQQGYMTLQGQAPGPKTLDDLFSGGGQFWENVDWSKTRAYAMGLGQIYINLRGREGRGIVDDGPEYKRLVDEIAAKLLTMTDPKTGAPVVHAVYKGRDVWSGPYMKNAPDLQVGLSDGYRVSWQTTLGGSPPGLVYPNMKKWSGDHGAFDYKQTSGILVSNRKIDTQAPSVKDIAPTVIQYFGIPIPGDIDGHALFAAPLAPTTTARSAGPGHE
jgi:predicted AlkP superfamily phosphohydrolase/phosphomutase